VYDDETPSETKHTEFGLNASETMILREEHLGQAKKFEDFELQELLDENPAQMLIEMSKALMLLQRPQNACMPWKRFIKKRYGYHMSCQKMPS